VKYESGSKNRTREKFQRWAANNIPTAFTNKKVRKELVYIKESSNALKVKVHLINDLFQWSMLNISKFK